MFFLIFTPWPSTKILADPGLEPALVEPISFTFPALTTMPFVLGYLQCHCPSWKKFLQNTEFEPVRNKPKTFGEVVKTWIGKL